MGDCLSTTRIGRVIAMLLVLVAACWTGAHAEPQRGGTLNSTLWPEPPGIVIGIHLNSPTLLPATKIFEGLLT